MNAIKSLGLKQLKDELYLRLEMSAGKKAELQDRLLEVIRLKKNRCDNTTAVNLVQLAAKRTNKKKKNKIIWEST